MLEKAKIANPVIAVRDRRPHPVPRRRPAGGRTKLILRTDLEPDVAKNQLDQLKKSLADDPDLLSSDITNFGGTVAAETRTLALIATSRAGSSSSSTSGGGSTRSPTAWPPCWPSCTTS